MRSRFTLSSRFALAFNFPPPSPLYAGHAGYVIRCVEECYISFFLVTDGISRFQALADRIAVSCSLVRGDYNRAWNEVKLCDEVKVSELYLLCVNVKYKTEAL